MKRSIIFSSATVAGLAGVLTFHTSPVALTIGGFPTSSSTSTSTARPTTTTPAGASPPSTSSTVRHAVAPTTSVTPRTTTTHVPVTTTTHASVATTTVQTGSRTAVGERVNYYFGILSVSVTASGSKLTKVTIATLNDGGNARSQYIDQQSIPMLEQEAMQAQSAKIQSISGASYTSAGFAQSLQSALSKLGI